MQDGNGTRIRQEGQRAKSRKIQGNSVRVAFANGANAYGMFANVRKRHERLDTDTESESDNKGLKERRVPRLGVFAP